ncbi:hypothetical protein A0H81_12825 [Grifola frondosa]|uniref:Uncharacterized protein n=1 Tax=Grifola frondosa TaxID=5627 RepID=A0A1C7LSJ9_GRIFR|nr:hypothetical protein A0H81_12825 [Grifola frondosa]
MLAQSTNPLSDFKFSTIGQEPALLRRMLVPADDLMSRTPPSSPPTTSPKCTVAPLPEFTRRSLFEALVNPDASSPQTAPPSIADVDMEPTVPFLNSTDPIAHGTSPTQLPHFPAAEDYIEPPGIMNSIGAEAGASSVQPDNVTHPGAAPAPSSTDSQTRVVSVHAVDANLSPFLLQSAYAAVSEPSPAELYTLIAQLAQEEADWEAIRNLRERYREELEELLLRHDETIRAANRAKDQAAKFASVVETAFDKVEAVGLKQEQRRIAEKQKAQHVAAEAQRLQEESLEAQRALDEERRAEAQRHLQEQQAAAAAEAKRESERLAAKEQAQKAEEERRRLADEEAARKAAAESEFARAAEEKQRRDAAAAAAKLAQEEAEKRKAEALAAVQAHDTLLQRQREAEEEERRVLYEAKRAEVMAQKSRVSAEESARARAERDAKLREKLVVMRDEANANSSTSPQPASFIAPSQTTPCSDAASSRKSVKVVAPSFQSLPSSRVGQMLLPPQDAMPLVPDDASIPFSTLSVSQADLSVSATVASAQTPLPTRSEVKRQSPKQAKRKSRPATVTSAPKAQPSILPLTAVPQIVQENPARAEQLVEPAPSLVAVSKLVPKLPEKKSAVEAPINTKIKREQSLDHEPASVKPKFVPSSGHQLPLTPISSAPVSPHEPGTETQSHSLREFKVDDVQRNRSGRQPTRKSSSDFGQHDGSTAPAPNTAISPTGNAITGSASVISRPIITTSSNGPPASPTGSIPVVHDGGWSAFNSGVPAASVHRIVDAPPHDPWDTAPREPPSPVERHARGRHAVDDIPLRPVEDSFGSGSSPRRRRDHYSPPPEREYTSHTTSRKRPRSVTPREDLQRDSRGNPPISRGWEAPLHVQSLPTRLPTPPAHGGWPDDNNAPADISFYDNDNRIHGYHGRKARDANYPPHDDDSIYAEPMRRDVGQLRAASGPVPAARGGSTGKGRHPAPHPSGSSQENSLLTRMSDGTPSRGRRRQPQSSARNASSSGGRPTMVVEDSVPRGPYRSRPENGKTRGGARQGNRPLADRLTSGSKIHALAERLS